jgi:hypothetical protein
VTPRIFPPAIPNLRGIGCVALLLFSGCQQPPTEVKAQTVEARPAKMNVTPGLNPQDLDQVTNNALTHLFVSPQLTSSAPSRLVLAVQMHPGSDPLDLQANSVLQHIRIALLQSGKVVFRDGAVGVSTPIDGLLSGKFSQRPIDPSGSNQAVFDFDLEWKNASGELTQWTDRTTITKTSRKASTGW